MRSTADQPVPRAFTIVEVVVVVLIIGMLGALVVPRLLSVAGRQAEVEAEAVRAVLSGAAQRDAVSAQPVALVFRAGEQPDGAQRIEVETLAQGAPAGEEQSGAQAGAQWKRVPLIRPANLALTELSAALIDGQPMVLEGDWRATLTDGGTGAAITLLVRTRAGVVGQARAWQIDLVPGQTGATLRAVAPDAAAQPVSAGAQDLDEEGQRNSTW